MAIDAVSARRAPDDDEVAAAEGARAERGEPESDPADYDVVAIGGGPAGLAAGAFCGRKFLRTAVVESDSWGGILTRWCPGKRIDNYPGVRPGIRAMIVTAVAQAASAAHEAYREIRSPYWK